MAEIIESVKREELARILGLSPTMINRLVKDGMPKISHGRYNLAAAVQWYIQTWRDRAEGGGVGNLWDEKKKQVIAQTQRTELENAKLREEMIPAVMVAHTLNEVAVIVSTQLDGLGGRVSSQVAALTDPGEVQAVIFDEARAIRRAIAGSIKSYATLPDDGPHNKPATKKKRGKVGKRKSSTPTRKPRARPVQK